MNGVKIPDEQVKDLLALADWAPTHGYTEPWRFRVYADPSKFCNQHAELYKQSVSFDDFNPSVYSNLFNQGNKASHVILVTMERGNLPKIPVWEEEAAVSSAIQNILLGATALNIASFWSTGGMALKPEMHEFLGLGDQDRLMGVLYLGYADQHPRGERNIPLTEKTTWIS